MGTGAAVPDPDPRPEADWNAEPVPGSDPKLQVEAEPDSASQPPKPEGGPIEDPEPEVEADLDVALEPSGPEVDPADAVLKKAATVCWRLEGLSQVTSVEMSMPMISWGSGCSVAELPERGAERSLRFSCGSGVDESSLFIRSFKFCRIEEEAEEDEEAGKEGVERRWSE